MVTPVEVFAILNCLLSIFVLVFAIFYLRQVWGSKSYYPWMLLFIASLIYFVLQAANLLSVAGYFSMDVARWIFDLVFLVVLLFTFVFQYFLLTVSEAHHKKSASKSALKKK